MVLGLVLLVDVRAQAGGGLRDWYTDWHGDREILIHLWLLWVWMERESTKSTIGTKEN